MHILLIVMLGLFGAARFGLYGAVLGGLGGYLLAELIALKKKVSNLEKRLGSGADAEDEQSPVTSSAITKTEIKSDVPVQQTVSFKKPVVEKKVENISSDASTLPPQEASGHTTLPDRFFQSLEHFGSSGSEAIKRFAGGGNLVLKVGLIILFFGVAFLLKYAAQRNLLPIEARLAAAAAGGIVLLVLGYRLRARAFGYGLGLQGGGVGILYLVIFAAAKLYSLLPLTLAFVVMTAIVGTSAALAVLQNARWLAIFGVIGGFMAPVLMSSGSGSHVMLFSYFWLLNVGIVSIAWFKAWRELNLIGFFFTFGIGTLWGSQGYHPEFFSSTEPFLISFFVFYVAISILFAYRQPVNLRGYIDGPLVFGLPIVFSTLQYLLVRNMELGMAFSSCGLGIFYLVLATILWRKLVEGMRLLCEAFLALGVVFASLTIPLALDSQWTTAAWSLEGAAMIWIGIRQHRQLARIFALLLQFGSAWLFVENVFYPFGAPPFINRHFFGCLFIAASALFTSYYFYKNEEKIKRWERFLVIPMLVWGMCWWYYGGLREMGRHFAHLKEQNAFLLFGCLSTILMAIIARIADWRHLAVAQLILLPFMYFCFFIGLLEMSYMSHLFADWGALIWGVAVFTQYRLMHQSDTIWPGTWAGYWHAASLWLVTLLLCLEASWLVDVRFNLPDAWSAICWGLIPGGSLLMVLRFIDRLSWPGAAWRSYYLGPAAWLLLAGIVAWSVVVLQEAGDPAPLPYLPVLNPLELSSLFVLLVVLIWVIACKKGKARYPGFLQLRFLYLLVAALGFLWLNGIAARSVHYYSGIPYYADSLYQSVVFQAAIAALWSIIALTSTVWAARSGNRVVWLCGAALLGLVVVKLFLVDLSGTGTIARIVSFLSVGILMLVIGYFSPMPPKKDEELS